jgi:hypothetical protein
MDASCIRNLPPGVGVWTDLTAIYLTPPPLTLPWGCGESTHARVYSPAQNTNEVGYGMEMDLYKSQILDGALMVLVQKQNCTSRCLKLHVSVSQFFGTKRTHSHIPWLKGKAFFSELFFRCVC